MTLKPLRALINWTSELSTSAFLAGAAIGAVLAVALILLAIALLTGT